MAQRQLIKALIDDARTHLLRRWVDDEIIVRYANVPSRHKGPASVRAFIADMLAMPAAALHNPDLGGTEKLLGKPPFCQLATSRFGDLLAAELCMKGKDILVETLARQTVFLQSLLTVIDVDLRSYPVRGGLEQRARFDLMETFGLSVSQFDEWIRQPAQVATLTESLWPDVRAVFARKPLREFFVRKRQNGWFCDPDSIFDSGLPKTTRRVTTGLGEVTVDAQRYNTEMPRSSYVYEWRSKLCDAEGQRLAAAWGTAYVPVRKNCSAYNLLSTADEVSDADIMLVRALIDQHPDRFADGIASGLAFLTHWERHSDAAKGAGAEVLVNGLAALKQLVPKITLLAIDLQPPEFRDWDLPNEPPEVTAAKQESREQIAALIDTLRPEAILGPTGERFMMLQRHDTEDAYHAVYLLGEAEMALRGARLAP